MDATKVEAPSAGGRALSPLAEPSPNESVHAPGPKLSRSSLAALIALMVAIVAAARLWLGGLNPLEPNGPVPPDLFERQEQLRELRLPSSIQRVDWLASNSNLKKLSLAQTEVSSLRGLPRSLVELDASNTRVANLEGIPASVRVLDLSWTQVADLKGAPKHLETLYLAGRRLRSVRDIPPAVSTLSLRESRIGDLRDLPPQLRNLTLTGPAVESVVGLPTSLQVLRIEGTLIRNLDGLPSGLESLVVLQNRQLTGPVSSLPLSLANLEMDVFSALPLLQGIFNLRSLSLRMPDPQLGTPKSPLPRFLSSLLLELSSEAESDPATPKIVLPSSLRSLTLLYVPQGRIPDLPEGLESLDLSWYEGRELTALPSSLRLLSLRWSNVESLDGLGESIISLDLSASAIRSIQRLPSRLRELHFQWSPLIETGTFPSSLAVLDLAGSKNLSKIGSFPPALTGLNVSQTKVGDLKSLPPSIQWLDISNTNIDSWDDLPEPKLLPNLESLTLSVGQLKSLEKLPSSVRSLFFVDKANP